MPIPIVFIIIYYYYYFFAVLVSAELLLMSRDGICLFLVCLWVWLSNSAAAAMAAPLCITMVRILLFIVSCFLSEEAFLQSRFLYRPHQCSYSASSAGNCYCVLAAGRVYEYRTHPYRFVCQNSSFCCKDIACWFPINLLLIWNIYRIKM